MTAAETPRFQSQLASGRERFLAQVVEHALEIEHRSAADFLRHFPAAAIMQALAEQPELRAQLLVLTTGVRQKIAIRKTADSAGEDLQIALDEGETDAESIVALFDPDDRIRYLDARRLWTFCAEGEPWRAMHADPITLERTRRQIEFVIVRALAEGLLSDAELVESISIGQLAAHLPRELLATLLERALSRGHERQPFTETELLSLSPPLELVRHLPLPHLWEKVVLERIAERQDLVGPAARAPEVSDWPSLVPEAAQARTAPGAMAPPGPAAATIVDTSPQAAAPRPTADLTSDAMDEAEITDDDIRIG